MNKKELTWEEVIANLNLTEEDEDIIRIEEEMIDAVVKARKEKNITQEKLGELCGIKQSAIARIERHINSPKTYTFLKLLYAMGYTIKIVPIEKSKE